MLKTLFIIDDSGLVLIEKHWRGITPRDVCDVFWQDVLACSSYEDMPTVKQYGRVYVAHVYRSGIFFAGIVEREVSACFAPSRPLVRLSANRSSLSPSFVP